MSKPKLRTVQCKICGQLSWGVVPGCLEKAPCPNCGNLKCSVQVTLPQGTALRAGVIGPSPRQKETK
jgi:hypothetical protein